MTTLIHSQTKSQVDAIRQTRSGSYIFHGQGGMGKSKLAYELAAELGSVGPDLITLAPEDKPSIIIAQAQELVRTLSLSPYYQAGVRVVVIQGAHLLTTEAQNALLKVIEEPPAGVLFILVTDRVEALLTTVRSRCAAIYFPQVTETEIAALLVSQHNIKPSDAAILAAAAEGAPGVAVSLATQPEETASRLALRDLAVAATQASLFDRLLMAKRLIDSKADLLRFGRALHAQVVGQLRSGERSGGAAIRRMQALERFRCHLVAKVSPRVALERLMLEL